MSADPVILAEDARIAVDGVAAIERLSLATTGDRVLLAGDAGALLSAITGVPRAAVAPAGEGDGDDERMPGEAFVVAGTLRLAGRDVEKGEHVAIMGAAPLDPPLPPKWTAEEYVAWSARLAGVGAGAARRLAAAALDRTGIGPLRRRALGSLALPERRVLALAQAVATGPEVLVAEAPLSSLEGAAAAFVLQAIGAVTEGRKALLSATRLDAGSAEGTLARGASHVVVIAGGEVAASGPPGELFAAARVVSLAVRTNAGPLRDELAARGIDLRGGPVRFSAALPPGASTREILAAAQAARAAVVEMVPLFG
jgi:ABC-2 type transport system ATP-binding protein